MPPAGAGRACARRCAPRSRRRPGPGPARRRRPRRATPTSPRSAPSSPKSLPVARRRPSSCTSVAREAAARVGRRRGPGRERALEVPVRGAHERHALTLTLDDEADGDALDPPDRGALAHLLARRAGQRAVAVDPVEEPAGLLGVDQATVDVAGVLDGLADGLRGDLVEHHALHRQRRRRVEHLEQVPRDGLALAILISGEIELGGVLHELLEIPDAVTLVGAHHVEGLEVVVDLDAEDLPLALVGIGHVGGAGRAGPGCGPPRPRP